MLNQWNKKRLPKLVRLFAALLTPDWRTTSGSQIERVDSPSLLAERGLGGEVHSARQQPIKSLTESHCPCPNKAAFLPVKLLLLAALTLVMGSPLHTVNAHGASITYSLAPTVHIIATYDSGDPMIQAQVTIYAPDDPATPWLQGETDEDGGFSFVPDPAITGIWAIQVRQAGHGDILNIPIGTAGSPLSGSTGGFTPLQIIVMSAAIIWGFVGTALYFSNRQTQTAPNREED